MTNIVSIAPTRQLFAKSTSRSTPRGTYCRVRVFLSGSDQDETIMGGLQLHCPKLICVTLPSSSYTEIPRFLDLELIGSIQHIQKGLEYLESLHLPIRGKPNPDGDSWYC